jgi:hypothetical protein
MGNLGDRTHFDACIYTTNGGREQLRIAALVLAKAVLGYDQDADRRSAALTYQTLLSTRPGALDLCNQVRDVWELGTQSVAGGTSDVKPAFAQLEKVADNIYRGGGSKGIPWWGWGLLLAGGAGAAFYGYRRYRNLLPASRS